VIDLELWRAKASAIAAFAMGPGVMIIDDDERDARIASILVLLDIEYESTESTTRLSTLRTVTSATITDIHAGEIHASNSQINWSELVDQIRANPSKPVKLLYDKHHTAVVTAARVNKDREGVSAFTERRGDSGIVIITAD
jgi:hypothetical protein